MINDDSADVRWLSYSAMAEALGITLDSARRLVARHKQWPRKTGNDGRTLVGVPVERIPDKPPVAIDDDIEDDVSDDRDDITPVVSVLTQHIERLEKELVSVKSERDEERTRAAVLALKAAEVDALKSVIELERKRADDLKTERDRWADQVEKLLDQRQQPVERRGLFGWLRRA